MKRKLFALLFVLILTFGLAIPALAQSYSFSLDKEIVNVYWNADGTLALDYQFTFTNSPGGHVIDFVDVGMPNGNYGSTSADVSGNPLNITSDYQGQGSYGFSVDMGAYTIQPGQTGTVHVYVDKITGVLYPDDKDQTYASAVFAPTWFGSQYVNGTTDLSITFHLPPGVKPEEPRWHDAPSGFPSQPQTELDSQGRVSYNWSNPSASGSTQYTFGASFPKQYVPDSAIVQTNSLDAIFGLIAGLFAFIASSLPCLFFAAFFVGIPILSAIQGQRRKLQYISPKISIEGHGIKRGLTAVETAILMEQPLDKVLTMALFSVVKKNAAVVTTRDPLVVTVSDPMPSGLHDYEVSFLNAFKLKDSIARRKALQAMVVELVKSVSEKMKGFSRNETIEYYKRIMETAWEQVQKADTPEVQSVFFDQQLEWTMLDKDYDDRSRRTFTGPIFMPMWWGNYDPAYRGMTSQARPIGTSGPSLPSMPGSPSSRSMPQLPGADFAASMVTGVQSFSQRVIGNISDFTSGVTNVTNPPPKPSSGSYRSGGGGCACACACAGCACACAGGGR